MELRVEIVKLGPIEKHPDADNLGIIQVYGYPVVCRLGDFKEGDNVVYVPIDAMVPFEEDWKWLHQGKQKNCRVQAKKIRGVFSMGLLVPIPPVFSLLPEGTDIKAQMRITKWEPELHGPYIAQGATPEVIAPESFVKYTDVEHLLSWTNVLQPGEPVMIMEKIHGANWRAGWNVKVEGYDVIEETFYVGSHGQFRKKPDNVDNANIWWKAALDYWVDEKLSMSGYTNVLLFGEVYGPVQKGFNYGSPDKPSLVIFDAYDTETRRYYDAYSFMALAADLDLPTAPVLYEGPWTPLAKSFVEGNSLLDGKTLREGFVVRPITERWHPKLGRVILKHLNPEYLLLKKGSDGK